MERETIETRGHAAIPIVHRSALTRAAATVEISLKCGRADLEGMGSESNRAHGFDLSGRCRLTSHAVHVVYVSVKSGRQGCI